MPATNYVPPAPLATAGSEKSSGLMQGSALPNITTTSGTATSVPQWYMDAIQQIGTEAAKTAQGSNYIGATDLQNQAYKDVKKNVGNYNPTLNKAINYASSVGDSNIVDALGNLNQQNIATTLAPNAVAGIAGTGQFGSSRGAGALGSVISNANIATQAQQAQGMQQDYVNRLNASQQLGTLAGDKQKYALNDVNALNTLGAEKQKILQNKELFPMQQLTNEAALLKGLTIPTSTSSTYTGPVPGAYSASPLAQIAGLGTLATGLKDLIPGLSTALKNVDFSKFTSADSALKYIFGNSGQLPPLNPNDKPENYPPLGDGQTGRAQTFNPLIDENYYNSLPDAGKDFTYGDLKDYYGDSGESLI